MKCLGRRSFLLLWGWRGMPTSVSKWSVLLQLETETKAWLRASMVAHGVSIEERTEDRDKGLARARERASLPWPQAMQSMYDGLSRHYVPLYQSFADAARTRGEAGQEAVCLYMVEQRKSPGRIRPA